VVRFAPPQERGVKPSFAVLTHDYVRREVYRSPDLSNPYGKRTNWGEKVYLKFDPGSYLVINVPTGEYKEQREFSFGIGSNWIRPYFEHSSTLVSHKFEGALFPVELANGVASMSSYPSAKVLQLFAGF